MAMAIIILLITLGFMPVLGFISRFGPSQSPEGKQVPLRVKPQLNRKIFKWLGPF
jgi:hypothetical protein